MKVHVIKPGLVLQILKNELQFCPNAQSTVADKCTFPLALIFHQPLESNSCFSKAHTVPYPLYYYMISQSMQWHKRGKGFLSIFTSNATNVSSKDFPTAVTAWSQLKGMTFQKNSPVMPQNGNQWERENDITSQLKWALWLKIVYLNKRLCLWANVTYGTHERCWTQHKNSWDIQWSQVGSGMFCSGLSTVWWEKFTKVSWRLKKMQQLAGNQPNTL